MTSTSRAAAVVACALLLAGCARRVPVAELEARDASVGAVVRLTSGEALSCRLLSLSTDALEVEVYYPVGGDVELWGTGEDRRVVSGGEQVAGDLVSVERDGVSRTAVVRRMVAVSEVTTATFHRSGSEASLGPILSLLVGPVIGALLALSI
ncbi:MAG: hypothetical protein ABIG03_03555 [Candidatus Eisenbacteria bacterium]